MIILILAVTNAVFILLSVRAELRLTRARIRLVAAREAIRILAACRPQGESSRHVTPFGDLYHNGHGHYEVGTVYSAPGLGYDRARELLLMIRDELLMEAGS